MALCAARSNGAALSFLLTGVRLYMDKLIINAAITGIVPTKAENPNLPTTPSDL